MADWLSTWWSAEKEPLLPGVARHWLPVIKREMKAFLADCRSGKLELLGIEDKDIKDAAPSP